MIGQLMGKVIEKFPPRLLVDVGGVGYELEAPMTAFYDLPEAGGMVTLHTHLVIRDDAHLLFGFTDLRQRDLFRELLKISGIGPRVGLAILSGLTSEDLVGCISAGDADRLTRVPGIGRKTAERLIVELRDRFKSEAVGGSVIGDGRVLTPEEDAVSALVALGYRAQDAAKAVTASRSEGDTVENIIRAALGRLAGGRA